MSPDHPQANLRCVVMGYFRASKAHADERAAKLGGAKARKPAPPKSPFR